MSIWPNPVHDQVLVRFDVTVGNSTVRLVDNSGRLILEEKVNLQSGQTETINTTSLSAGIYYLQLISNNKMKVIPFVKQ